MQLGYNHSAVSLKFKCLITAILFVSFIPVSTLAFVKPLRVIFPEVVSGVSCYGGNICTDSEDRLSEARALYDDALTRTEAKVGDFHSRPKVIFCSTLHCSNGFGLTSAAARNTGDFGVVVAPRGWQEFYITHEFIHYRQAEELGMLKVWRGPRWLIEGMAYSLSEDPRHPLSEPMESWRQEFEMWYFIHHDGGLWKAVRAAAF
jgi:hypothetical protein